MFPIMFKSSLDWDLLGQPEPGLDDRRLYLPRGRMIGGCSSINAMIYLRGNRLDYDEWAEQGCDGWSYNDVLPYFKRGEDNERGENAYHGVGGPQTVSDSRSMHPLVDLMLEAAVQAGHPANPDLNGERPGRRRPVPAHPARRPAVQHRGCLPAPGGRPAATSRCRTARSSSGSSSKEIAPSASRSCGTACARRSAPSAR